MRRAGSRVDGYSLWCSGTLETPRRQQDIREADSVETVVEAMEFDAIP